MISDPSVTDPSRSLEQLTEQFNQWRATRTGRGITPPELRSRAVALLDHYSRATITRQLGVNSTAFGQWVRLERGEDALVRGRKRKKRVAPTLKSEFVELPRASYIDATTMAEEPESMMPSASPITTPLSDLMVELPDGTRIVARGSSCAERLLVHLWQQKESGVAA